MTAHVTGKRNDKPPLKHQPLTVGEARELLSSAPDEAVLNAIMWDRGSQRDPDPFLHGLSAVWEEER